MKQRIPKNKALDSSADLNRKYNVRFDILKSSMNERYSRQILFNGIGRDGQSKLLSSRVTLIGCGALGSAQAEMLARAGVGNLKLIDRDFVDYSNLQRQTLYSESDAEQHLPKVIAAKNRIAQINSDINVEAITADINNSNIENLIKESDLVLDGSDNFQVRYLLNDACIKLDIPWIYGAAVSAAGSTMVIIPGKTPCLNCLFDEMPDAGSTPTCDTVGVIMPVISTVAAMQVAEALKLLTGKAEQINHCLTSFDLWENTRSSIELDAPEPDCLVCGKREFRFLNAESVDFTAVLCGRDAIQIVPPTKTKLDLIELADRLSNLGSVRSNEYLVRFNADKYEITVFSDGRAIIRGTDDITLARSIYAKYIGL